MAYYLLVGYLMPKFDLEIFDCNYNFVVVYFAYDH